MVDFSGDLCGYVYITSSNSFTYYCIFCKSCFNSPNEFQNHNLKEHCHDNNIDESKYMDFKIDSILIQNTELLQNNNSLYQNSTISKETCENILLIEEDLSIKEEKHDEISETCDNIKNDSTLAISNNDIIISNNDHIKEEIRDKSVSFVPTKHQQLFESPHNLDENKELFPFGLNLDEINLQCKYCQKQFNKKTALSQHTKNHLNYILTCKICGVHSSDRRYATIHEKKHSKIECEICDANFLSDKAFENHMRRHEKLKCKYCSKVFKKIDKIQNHLRTHTGEKPYKCVTCSVAFALKRNLQTHVVTQHTGDIKNFACEYCDRKFKTKQLHKWHTKRVHLKEKPHQCEFCGVNFVNMTGLKRHQLKRHAEYNERPHHCKLCDKKFVELKKLTQHMNTHTGAKPFKCNTCFKTFGQYGTLREHRKLHTGKKTHICKICGKAFAQHSGCANHMKQQHNMIFSIN